MTLCRSYGANVTVYYLFSLIGYSYKVILTLDGPSWPTPGFMYVALTGDNDSTKEHQLYV